MKKMNIKSFMKLTIGSCLLFMSPGSSYGQGSYFENMLPLLSEFSKSSKQINSFNQLPEPVKNHFHQQGASELSFTERKIAYIAASKEYYMFVYDHGDSSDHYHTAVYQLKGNKIKAFSDFLIPMPRTGPEKLAYSNVQAIVASFVDSSQRFTSFNMLPEFIVNYIEQRNGAKFSMSERRFNATDAGRGPRRKLSYVAKLNDNYILAYQHGGLGYHCHSIVFETNGNEVTNVYNIIHFEEIKEVHQLMNIVGLKWFWLRNGHL